MHAKLTESTLSASYTYAYIESLEYVCMYVYVVCMYVLAHLPFYHNGFHP